MAIKLALVDDRWIFLLLLDLQHFWRIESINPTSWNIWKSWWRSRITTHQPRIQWFGGKYDRIHCTMYIGTMVGGGVIQRIFTACALFKDEILVGCFDEWDCVFDTSCFSHQCVAFGVFGLDLVSSIRQEWKFDGDYFDTRHVEFQGFHR